jgi:hypothetical protein
VPCKRERERREKEEREEREKREREKRKREREKTLKAVKSVCTAVLKMCIGCEAVTKKKYMREKTYICNYLCL